MYMCLFVFVWYRAVVIFKQCLPCNSSSNSDANLLATIVAKQN